jgi:molecular chaperone HscB
MPRNHFEVLGFPGIFHLRSDELERKYLELSRKYHPDKFAKASPRERLEAVQKTTELNDAYKVVRDPARRAEHLLQLAGLDIADERDAVKPAPALLHEMMELNEQLDDARAAGRTEVVRELGEAVRERRAEAMKAIEEGFRVVEAGGDRSMLGQIAQAAIAMRYHARFLEQVETILESQPLKGEL